MTPEFSNSGVPQSELDILGSLFHTAGDKIAQIVLHPKGLSESSRAFAQARAAMMLRQIEQIVTGLNHAAAAWIGPEVSKAVIDGVTRGNQQLKAIRMLPEGSPIAGSFAMVDRGTVSVFAKDIYQHLSKAAGSMQANAKTALRATAQRQLSEAEIDRILAGGVIEGTPAQTIRTLRDAFSKVGDGKVTVIDKNGDPMDFDAGYYARMVARTKTREATVVARHERLQQEGVNLVSIVGRISKNFCTGYLGMVFSLDGKSSKYPALSELPSGGPPFHPNCSKSTRPFVEELANTQELDEADGVDGADKLVGVDAYTAQKRFKDLQLYQQVKESHATTAKKLFRK